METGNSVPPVTQPRLQPRLQCGIMLHQETLLQPSQQKIQQQQQKESLSKTENISNGQTDQQASKTKRTTLGPLDKFGSFMRQLSQ